MAEPIPFRPLPLTEQRANEISEAIAYGWDGGYGEGLTQGMLETRQHLKDALQPYLRHIQPCFAIDSDDPLDSRCLCGLRAVWR